MTSNASSANQSSGKAFQIIEVMAETGEPMMLRDIALKSNINASTALRMLNTLIEYGYVRKDTNTQRYTLSLKFARIARSVNPQNQIVDIVNPYLQILGQQCCEAACFAMERIMDILYLCVLDGPDGMLKIMNYIYSEKHLNIRKQITKL